MSCRDLMPNEWRRRRRRRRYRPIISCWPPTPWCPPAVAFCPKPEDAATGARLPDAAVRPAAPGIDGHRADRAERALDASAGRERRYVQSADDCHRSTRYLASHEGEGKAGGYAINGHAASLYSFSVRQLLGRCRAAAVRDGAVAARSWLAGAVSVSIRVATSPGEAKVAVVEGRRLRDFCLWRPGSPDGVGDVHRGRVIASVPAMAGAFVALADAEGFLPDSEGAKGLTAGTVLTVRVTRAAQGNKGPRLTAAVEPADGPVGLVRSGGRSGQAVCRAIPNRAGGRG